jgi:methyl-accepting chemotaxis protein
MGNVSIKAKLFGGFGIVLFIVLCMGIYVYSTVSTFDTISDKKALRYEQLVTVENLKLINTNIALVAMDSIVDKDSGVMSSDRVNELNSLFGKLDVEENKLLKIADTPEEKRLIQNIMDSFKKLEPIIKNDLKRLIESNAKNSEFAKLDDKIDGASGSMESDINKLVKSIKDELAEASQEEADYASSMKRNLIIILVIVLIVSIILATTISANITNALKSLNDGILHLLNSQDTSSRVKVNSKDELGEIGNNFNKYLDSIEDGLRKDAILIDNVKQVVDSVRDGKLTSHIEATTNNKSLQELKSIFNDMIDIMADKICTDVNKIQFAIEEFKKSNFTHRIQNPTGKTSQGLNALADIINEMLVENKTNGITLKHSATELLDNVHTLNVASNQTASSLEETAASLEQITSNISNNTDNVVKMSSYATHLTSSAKEGQTLASQTAKSMEEIDEQVSSINEAISVIDQIAFQTNILSLNAAVEAATAGESGKGFAVVAGEVRNLAGRSAEAANEIKVLVENATKKADEGKEISDKMIVGYKELITDITQTIELIKDVENVSKEQLDGINHINIAVSQLDQQTQQNTQVASNTKDIASHTNTLAIEIVESANKKEFIGKENIK